MSRISLCQVQLAHLKSVEESIPNLKIQFSNKIKKFSVLNQKPKEVKLRLT